MATAYATEAQIESNLKGFDASAGDTVTSAVLTDLIAEEGQTIDMHIQARYDIPITDADALIFLRKICIDLVVYRVSKILMPREQKELPNGTVIQDISHISAYKIAMQMLKDLMNGKTTLPSTTEEAKTFFSSYQDTNDTEKKFELDKVQW